MNQKLLVTILTGLSGIYLIGLHLYSEILHYTHTAFINSWRLQLALLAPAFFTLAIAILSLYKPQWAKYLLLIPAVYFLYGSFYAVSALIWYLLPPPLLLTVALFLAFTGTEETPFAYAAPTGNEKGMIREEE
jgi:hypothetical protein